MQTKHTKQLNHTYYASYWNESMIDYLKKSAGSRWFEYMLKTILLEVNKSSINSIADIGCGVGNKTKFMADLFPEAKVYGYDFSISGIDAAKKIHQQKNLVFKTEDITKPSHTKKYDLITAFDVLEHINDWMSLTKKMMESNNRYILISSPHGRMRNYEVHIGHVRNFKKGEIERFMSRNGYKPLKVYYAGWPFYSPITRDLTNIFYKDYAELPANQMSKFGELMHNMWYILYRYGSFKSKGDIFVGLFEKED